MQKTAVNAEKIFSDIFANISELKGGMEAEKMTKKEKEEIKEELDEVIALAKSIKSEYTR